MLPQGTVLAPLLTVAYLADLPAALRGGDRGLTVTMFADDVGIGATAKKRNNIVPQL